jgi:polysaccharide biosynthesis/export protein
MVQKIILYCSSLVLFTQCASYKQNIMFKTDNIVPNQIAQESLRAERNYIIQPTDVIALEVIANNGERLVEPAPETAVPNATGQGNTTINHYPVSDAGMVRLPLVGELSVAGLTLIQAQMILQKEYTKFYANPFVRLRFINKRVVVLGALEGQVLPLPYDNITLAEVLAMAKGLDNFSKASNIRVIRKEQVFVVDFSTVEGYRQGNMHMESGDIVYVEPVRRPVTESMQANQFVITLFTSAIALAAIFIR